jgi:fermentation-respiration switch protein FrsA (DUF1100 family)
MRSLRLYFLLFAFSFLAHAIVAAEYTAKPGPYSVGTLDQTWHDASRNRDVPVKIYFPKITNPDVPAKFPVIIFSHGLGGSRDGYAYLGEHWASCGYIVVYPQHHGSDKDVMHGFRPLKALREAAANPANAIDRPLDISFVIDRLTALNTDASFPLHGELDLAQLGVAGHSFGAFTTMAIAGAHFPVLGNERTYADPRVKAAIAMSTPTTQDNDEAFDDVKIPVFHMTGTKDESPERRRGSESDPVVGNTSAEQRLRPFRHTHHAPAYLLVFESGDHMVFSGRLTESRPSDSEFQARVLSGSTAFWDAWLKGDGDSRHWLDDGGFSADVGKLGTFELSSPKTETSR